MDIARPTAARERRRRRILIAVVVVIALAGITMGLSQLKPAAPTVDRSRCG